MTARLPILLSVPHAGHRVPDEVAKLCRLTSKQIAADGDEQAADIYDLREHVAEFVTTDVARAFVDLNRAVDDRGRDGIVKTHTCWNEPVYDQPLPEPTVEQLLERYYHPYHRRLAALAQPPIRLCVDGHTMAAFGPPIGPDTGAPRPPVCLGDVHGQTLPAGWMPQLAACFTEALDVEVAVNRPFAGGLITRRHGAHFPWVQVELSRGDFLPVDEKRARLIEAFARFCATLT